MSTIQTVISLQDNISSTLGNISAKIGSVASSAAKLTFDTVVTGIGAATTALGGLATAAINVGKDYETAMSQVQATMLIDKSTAEGAAQFEILSKAAEECGRTTAFSATEAAEGLNYLALAGYDATKAAEALPTVLKLAGAGAMDLGAASDMVTDSMSALGIAATQDNLSDFADKLAMTASSANASVAQMGEAILTVGGTAKNLAGGTTELNTSLGLLANAGIKGAEGGTHLRNMLLSLQGPTDDGAELLSKYGIKVYDTQGKMKSLNDIFMSLQKSMKGMSDAQKDAVLSTIFNKTDLAAAQAMLSQCGADYEELAAKIENSAGAADKMYDIQLDNLNGDMAKLQSGAEALGITFYNDIQEPLRGALQYATGLIETLSANYAAGGIVGMVSGIGDMLASVISKAVQYVPEIVDMATQLFISFVNGLTQNMGGIVQAVPALANALASGIANGVTSIGQLFIAFINSAAQVIPQLIPIVVQGILQLISNLTDMIPQLINAGLMLLTGIKQGIANALPLIMAEGPVIIENFINGIANALPLIMAEAPVIIENLVNGIIAAIPMIINAAVMIINYLVEYINQNIDQIITMAIYIIQTLIMGLIQALPLLLQGAVKIVMALISGLIKNLPLIIKGGIQIIIGIVTGIIRSIPYLISGLFSAINAISDELASVPWWQIGWNILIGLIDGIIEGAKSLASAVWDAIKAIFTGKSAEVETQGYDMGMDFSGGMMTGLDTMNNIDFNPYMTTDFAELGMNAGVSYSNGFNGGLTQTDTNYIIGPQPTDVSKIEKLFEETVNSAAERNTSFDWLTNGLSQANTSLENSIILVDNLDTALENFIDVNRKASDTISTNPLLDVWQKAKVEQVVKSAAERAASATSIFTETGIKHTNAYINAMASREAAVEDIGKRIVLSGKNGIESQNFKDSGANLIKGFAEGMINEESAAYEAAQRIAQRTSEHLNKALDIHSPSRVTFETGEMVSKGLALGMTSGVTYVDRATEGLNSEIELSDGDGIKRLVSGFGTNEKTINEIHIDMSGMTNEIKNDMSFNDMLELLCSTLERELNSNGNGVFA